MDDIVIWGEVLFFIDCSMDFLSLDFMCRIMRIRAKLRNLCAAAAIGAAVSVGVTAAGGRTFITVPVLLFTAFAVCMAVLPAEIWSLSLLPRAVCLFLLTEAALGGIMTVLYRLFDRIFAGQGFFRGGGMHGFLLSAFAAWGLLSLLLHLTGQKSTDGRTGIVTVRLGGREENLPCLFDSGNLAREPISGLPVVFLPSSSAGGFGIRMSSLASGEMPGSRIIPVSTVSGEKLFWGIRPELLYYRTPKRQAADAYIVFSDQLPGKRESTGYAVAPSGS